MRYSGKPSGPTFNLLLTLSLLAIAPLPSAAQAIRGVVVDDRTLTDVPGASVQLVRFNEGISGTITDDNGSFFLPVPEAGQYRLEVARMGYETSLSQLVAVPVGDTVSVEFRVRPDAVILEPITVVARSRRGRHTFERRSMEWDKGFFLSPATIDSIAPDHPAEILKGLEKVDVRWGWGQHSNGTYGRVPSVRTVLVRACMLYMVDYVPVRPEPWAPADWAGYQLSSPRGDDIVAVEVYRSVLETPPELRQHTDQLRAVWTQGQMGVTYKESIQCGLTVFWTEAGW